jgi:hypothetical protein
MSTEMQETSWHSYPKVWNLGHPGVADLFKEAVVVEEKIDGSQFSFGVFNGELRCRSKGKELVVDEPEKMFAAAVATALELKPKLIEGVTYRAEYLQKPHHNGLAYDRIPAKHLMLFDVNTAFERYLPPAAKQHEAARLGLECVPCFSTAITNPDNVRALLDRVSVLGGCKMEGLVFKNYVRFGEDKKALLAKHVREDFKEIQGKQWRVNNPTKGDIVQQLGEMVKSPARWEKAAQHIRERGELTDSPKDIGALLREVQQDVEAEFAAQAKEILWAHAKKQILRMAISGLPEWWKEKLLERQFKPEG